MMIRRFILFVRYIFYHVVAYVVAGRHLKCVWPLHLLMEIFLSFFLILKKSVKKFYLPACYIPMILKFRFLLIRGETEHVKEYPTMNYIRTPRHFFQSMIAYNILTEYVWEFQSKVALLVCC
mgnify:CR=1 FL=1